MLAAGTLYAATTDGCGGAANGVYALDLSSDAKTVTSWDAKGVPIVGTVAPTFGSDGTIYVATGAGASEYANAVVALDANGLRAKDWFSRRRVAVHLGAGRLPAAGEGCRGRGQPGRTDLPARQRVARRRRSQDAAREVAAVRRRRRTSRPARWRPGRMPTARAGSPSRPAAHRPPRRSSHRPTEPSRRAPSSRSR